MQKQKGIFLPDDDDHFKHHLERGPLFDGKGTYQLKKLDAALAYLPVERRGFAVDVGAHVGLWTRVLSSYFGKVWAYEPLPHLVECWRANVLGGNAILFEMALGEIAGHLPMVCVKGNTGNARVATPAEVERGKHITYVESKRLDGMPFPAKIDFLKIDVEGWELHVLRGGKAVIQKDKPLIVVEQKKGNAETYGEPRTGAVSYLQNLGFKVLWEISGDYCLAHPDAGLTPPAA